MPDSIETNPRGRRPYELNDSADATAVSRVLDEWQLDRNNTSPLWVQLKSKLEASIDSGQLPPNTRLPPEHLLCEYLSVSRPVVRAAISSLADEGKILKFPRKGMFVAAPREYIDFMHTNLGAFSDLTEKGFDVAVKTHELYLSTPNEQECEVFGINEKMSVVRLKRVYFKDGRPITLTRITLPTHRVPGLQKMDLDNRSLLKVIREQYGLRVITADRWLTATFATVEEAAFLEVSTETPLIAIRSVGREAKGAPLEYYEALMNPHVAEIHLKAGQ